jgi:hypothetical protein
MEATHYFLPFTIKIAQDINTIAVQNLASDWSAKAAGGKNLAPTPWVQFPWCSTF